MLSSTVQFIRCAPAVSSVLFVVLAACGGSTTKSSEVPKFDATPSTTADAGHTPPADAGRDTSTSTTHDTGGPAPAADTGGAAPRNSSCTPTNQQTGTAVTTSYGRLDGTLVYIVGAGQGQQCNGDDSHVHLQVEVSGEVYDVAVDIGKAPNDEVGMYQETLAVPGGAWSEGWHGSDSLVYPSIGVHSTSFVTADPDTIASQIEAALASTTDISIFCTGYTQGNGCHDVHYEKKSSGEVDGAIIVNPTAATSPILFFRFTSDSF
jgi:hypothetical protein